MLIGKSFPSEGSPDQFLRSMQAAATALRTHDLMLSFTLWRENHYLILFTLNIRLIPPFLKVSNFHSGWNHHTR